MLWQQAIRSPFVSNVEPPSSSPRAPMSIGFLVLGSEPFLRNVLVFQYFWNINTQWFCHQRGERGVWAADSFRWMLPHASAPVAWRGFLLAVKCDHKGVIPLGNQEKSPTFLELSDLNSTLERSNKRNRTSILYLSIYINSPAYLPNIFLKNKYALIFAFQ